MKYDEVYCSEKDETCTIDEVAYVFNTYPEQFASDFDRKMLCPGCRKVHMSYVNADTPHFRGYKGEDHAEDCIYEKEEMDPTEVKKLHDDPTGENAIIRQIDRLVIQFLREGGQATGKGGIIKPSPPEDDQMVFPKKRWQNDKNIPRKQLNAPFRENDFENEKLFYGKVHIKWEQEINSDKMKILIYGIPSKRFICKLYISKKVYTHLPKEYTVKNERDVFIVFLTTLIQKDKQKSWGMGYLLHSKFLSINQLVPNSK